MWTHTKYILCVFHEEENIVYNELYSDIVVVTLSEQKGWITFPFLNFIGATVEVWEWTILFIQHFNGHVIFNPCLIHVINRDTSEVILGDMGKI